MHQQRLICIVVNTSELCEFTPVMNVTNILLLLLLPVPSSGSDSHCQWLPE